MTTKELIRYLDVLPEDTEIYIDDVSVREEVAESAPLMDVEPYYSKEDNCVIIAYCSICMCDKCREERDRLTQSN